MLCNFCVLVLITRPPCTNLLFRRRTGHYCWLASATSVQTSHTGCRIASRLLFAPVVKCRESSAGNSINNNIWRFKLISAEHSAAYCSFLSSSGDYEAVVSAKRTKSINLLCCLKATSESGYAIVEAGWMDAVRWPEEKTTSPVQYHSTQWQVSELITSTSGVAAKEKRKHVGLKVPPAKSCHSGSQKTPLTRGS